MVLGMATDRDIARDLLDRASGLNVSISAILALPKEDRDYTEVGRLAGRQRNYVKRAEVHALLAIHDAVNDLAGDLEEARR